MSEELRRVCIDHFGLNDCVLIRQLGGGMAGSQVWLVNYSEMVSPALKVGVLKDVPPRLAEDFVREMEGSRQACESWLRPLAAALPEGREHEGRRLMLTRLALPANRLQANVSLHEILSERGVCAACRNAVDEVGRTYAQQIMDCVNAGPWERGSVFAILGAMLARWAGSVRTLDWTAWGYPGFQKPWFLDGDVLRVNPLWAAFEPKAWREQSIFMPWGFQHGDLNCRNILVFESTDASRTGADVRLIDWEKAGPAAQYLDLCWLSIWSLMALADDHVPVESSAWNGVPRAFVGCILGAEPAPVAGAFGPAVDLVAGLWGKLWERAREVGADCQTIRQQIALSLGAACLAKAFYEVRDLEKLRTGSPVWKPTAVRWAACFFRTAAIAWDESAMLAARADATSTVAFDVDPLVPDDLLGTVDRVFNDTWSTQDVETIGKHHDRHAVARAAAEHLKRSMHRRPDRIPDVITSLGRRVEKSSFADRVVRWMGDVIPLEVTGGGTQLSAAEQLLLVLCRLKQANHRGEGPDEFRDWEKLQALRGVGGMPQPLLIEADTTAAVTFSNVFDFEGAKKCLEERWPSLGALEATPGLEIETGRLHSSLGQYQAFTEDHARADASFRRAIALFERGGPARGGAAKDIEQTRTYLAINLLDWDPVQADSVINELFTNNQQIGVGIADAGPRFAADVDAAFLHHVFLRRAFLHDGAAKSYLERRHDWRTAAHHPWELIDFYRGMLLRHESPIESRCCFERAAELSLEGVSVLPAIGTVITAVGRCAGVVPEGALSERALGRAAREQHAKRLKFDFSPVIDALLSPSEERITGLLHLLTFNYR